MLSQLVSQKVSNTVNMNHKRERMIWNAASARSVMLQNSNKLNIDWESALQAAACKRCSHAYREHSVCIDNDGADDMCYSYRKDGHGCQCDGFVA